jgi:hypothetical protein
MLSFMREDEPLEPNGEAPQGTAEETKEQEYLTVAAQDKNVRKTTCLLAVLFGIGLLCLWFMIKKSVPQTAMAMTDGTEEAQIERAINRLTGIRSETFSQIDEIVEKFYEFSDVQQVKTYELVKNPFKREIFLVNVKESSDNKERDSDTDIMRQQAGTMQLLSIMRSDDGDCCMIDDRILYTGDSIGGFKVGQITDSFVKLVRDPKHNKGRLESRSESLEIILKLSE